MDCARNKTDKNGKLICFDIYPPNCLSLHRAFLSFSQLAQLKCVAVETLVEAGRFPDRESRTAPDMHLPEHH